MNLLVDIGNSRVKWALARQTELVESGVIERGDADEFHRLPWRRAKAVYVASVADARIGCALRDQAAQAGLPVHPVATRARFGRLVNGYRRPEQLGVDRWLACIGAIMRGPGSVLVADAGTALTLDAIDGDGTHQGGLIVPGVSGMRSALRMTTRLDPTHAGAAGPWLAQDTATAIGSGTLQAALALLESVAARFGPDRLLLTGGEAMLLRERLHERWEYAPLLVLEGLAHYASAAQSSAFAAG